MAIEMMPEGTSGYPVQYDVEYPQRSSRWLLLWRALLLSPLAYFWIVAYLIVALWFSLLQLVSWVAVINDGKYPSMLIGPVTWWLRLSARMNAYLLLLTDQSPLHEESPLSLTVAVPTTISRWTAGFRWLLTIPHAIVLPFVGIAALLVTIIAWFAILFTGRYPKGLFGFVVGYQRWSTRVAIYNALLVDRYPPFSLDP